MSKENDILVIESIIVKHMTGSPEPTAASNCANEIIDYIFPKVTDKFVTRDASTGRFVSKVDAVARPKETIVQKVVRALRGKPL